MNCSTPESQLLQRWEYVKDEWEKEYGFLRRITFLKCPIKGKKGKKAWVHEMYEGRQAYDARFGGARGVDR